MATPTTQTATPAPPVSIAAPDSAEEREADRIADSVMRGAAFAPAAPPDGPPAIHRQCAACASGGPPCADCEDEPTLMLKRSEGGAPTPAGVGNAASVVSGGGRPLPHATRSYFEPRFGTDLSGVRIHTDPTAATAAKAINARAYALGSHIAFGRGQFAPGTEGGKRLIAHELAHVVAGHGGGRVLCRDMLDEARERPLTTSELEPMTAMQLEQLEQNLRSSTLLIVSGPEADIIQTNLALIEKVVRQKFASGPAPPPPRLIARPRDEEEARPSPQPAPGTGAYAAWTGMGLSTADNQTHWDSQSSRREFIREYITYARENGLTEQLNTALSDYPDGGIEPQVNGDDDLFSALLGQRPGDQTSALVGSQQFQIQPLAQAPPEGRRVVRRVEIFVPEVSGPGGILPTRAFSNAYPVGETYMVQDAPDPSAGWNFDTYIDGPSGRIAAQHLGGTRYRVFMGSPECPGCHFGRGLEVDFQGQSFLEVLVPNMVSGLSAMGSMRATTAMSTPRTTQTRPASPMGGGGGAPRVSVPQPGGGQVVPIRPPAAANTPPQARAFSGNNALRLDQAPTVTPAPAQPQPIRLPNIAPANNNAYLTPAAPGTLPPSPLLPTLFTGTTIASGSSQGTAASPAPGQGPQPGDRETPCDYPLPLAWPSELPSIPWVSLVRSSGAGRSEQGRMQREINAARGTSPPPSPCDDDVLFDSGRWNDPFDAHHIHPLFLGGGDTRSNLCSLNAAFHQSGHPRLASQTEYLDVYRQCGINSGNLNNHPLGQVYFIERYK